jgi:hypothetical protein
MHFYITPRPFYPTKITRYPFHRRLDDPQSWSGRFADKKNLLTLLNSNHGSSSPQPSHYIYYANPAPTLPSNYIQQSKIVSATGPNTRH